MRTAIKMGGMQVENMQLWKQLSAFQHIHVNNGTIDNGISPVISSTWLLLTLLILVEAVRVHLVFSTHCFYEINTETVCYVMCCC